MTPAAPAERIAALDALRAVALLGVALANVLSIAGTDWLEVPPFEASAEPWTLRLVMLLVSGKAYALFAFLFGAGFALQADRLEARGVPVDRVLKRRYAMLAGFGLAHSFLLWSGDILLAYAVVGFALLAFRRREQATLLAVALAVLLANAVLVAAAGSTVYEDDELVEEVASENASTRTARLAAYGEGSIEDVFAQRARDFLPQVAANIEAMPQILALFLLGLWAARSRILSERRGLKLAAMLLLTAGAAGEIVAFRLSEDGTRDYGRYLAGHAVHLLSAPALALGAAAAFLLVQPERLTAWLAPLGRMTLTGYLLQSLVFTTVFYSYGGALYGRVDPSEALALAAAVWLLELLFARLWLARFSMGPAEALWRRLTYGPG